MMTKLSTSLLIATSLVACIRNGSESTDTVEGALDNQESVQAEGDVMVAAVDGADVQSLTAPTADQIAARIATNVENRYKPAGCATATASGANIAVSLNDCSGPRGLLHVSGDMAMAVSLPGNGQIAVHTTASGLQVNAATMDIDANATLSVSASGRLLTVHSEGSGIGPRGNAIEHQGDYTVQWDPSTQCRAIAGHWSTELSGAAGSATRGNDVDVERCGGGCPTGSIVHTFLRGGTVTVTFDGTSTAQWSGSNGKSGTIALQCQ